MTDDGAIFARIYPGLRRFAAAVASPDVDPDDLVQEAVTRALRRGPLAGLDDPGSYLRRAIVNLARNHHRDQSRRFRVLRRFAPDGELPDQYPSDFVDLSALTLEQRAVLYLRFVEGLSIATCAGLLDLSEPAVRARTARAMRTLRVEFREGSPADENA